MPAGQTRWHRRHILQDLCPSPISAASEAAPLLRPQHRHNHRQYSHNVNDARKPSKRAESSSSSRSAQSANRSYRHRLYLEGKWLSVKPLSPALRLTDSEVSAALHIRTVFPGAATQCRHRGSRDQPGHDESPRTRLKRGAGDIYSLRRFGQRCFVVAYTMQADQVPVGAIGATFIHPLKLPDLLAPLRPSPSRCPWVNRACVLPGRAEQLQLSTYLQI